MTNHAARPTAVRGYIDHKDAQLKRLRRIEGQVRGLQRMVETDTYCIDILTQVSAATKALEAVALGLLDDHLALSCPRPVRRSRSRLAHQRSLRRHRPARPGLTTQHQSHQRGEPNT